MLSSLFKMHVCEMILETEGVLGYVSLDCFPLDLIPLDIDLLSMELPEFLRTFYMVSNLNTTKFRSAEMSGGFAELDTILNRSLNNFVSVLIYFYPYLHLFHSDSITKMVALVSYM